MSQFVPTTTAFDDAVKDRRSARYYRLRVDRNEDGDVTDSNEDLSHYIYRNSLRGGGKLQGSSGEAVANKWSVTLVNTQLGLSSGELKNAKVTIEAQAGSAGYITIFTGYVSDEGASRAVSWASDDLIKLEFFDRFHKLKKVKTDSGAILANYKVCDPSDTSASLLHYLADELGVAAGDIVAGTISDVKDLLTVPRSARPVRELQALSETWLGMLKFRYDDKLVFESWFESGYTDPASEWTFGGAGTPEANIHDFKVVGSDVISNRVKMQFDDYEALNPLSGDSHRVVYKNTKNYDETTDEISIEVAAGDYWPGPGAQDVLLANYRDPESGEALIATNVQTPTIGTAGTEDIVCSGGTLTIVSFNGSTSATKQSDRGSELILRNNTGSPITITRLRLRGTAYRVATRVTVEAVDSTVTNNYDFVEKQIDGKYAADIIKAKQACEWWMEYGKVDRKAYDITVDWTPQIQEGALVTVKEPVSGGSTVVCQVMDYEHVVNGRTMAGAVTQLKLREWYTFTSANVGSSAQEDQTDPSTGTGDNQDHNTPTYDDLDNGYTASSGGTVTPTQPTAVASPAQHGVVLRWDRQDNLTNFERYEVQVSDDAGSTWHSLEFGGDGKDAADPAVTLWYSELLVHAKLPLDGTTDDPQDKTFHYRLRRRTKLGDVSAWSATVSADCLATGVGDIAANSISANQLQAGVLNAQIANINTNLTIDSTEGYVAGNYMSPVLGNVKWNMTEEILEKSQYDGSAWQRNISLGDSTHGFRLSDNSGVDQLTITRLTGDIWTSGDITADGNIGAAAVTADTLTADRTGVAAGTLLYYKIAGENWEVYHEPGYVGLYHRSGSKTGWAYQIDDTTHQFKVVGRLETLNGIKTPNYYWNEANQNQNFWFDTLAPELPNTGDVIAMRGIVRGNNSSIYNSGGGAFASDYDVVISHAYRSSSTEIRMYGYAVGAVTICYIRCVNGSGIVATHRSSLSW